MSGVAQLAKRRWESFAQGLASGKSALEVAKSIGYSVRSSVRLAQDSTIQARVRELQQAAASATVMTILERKERLSEIARARLTDFVGCGADGSWINVGLESVNSAAIQEVTSSTEYDEDGSKPTVVTKLKLHDPVKAIAELNKMDGAYAPEKVDVSAQVSQDSTVHIDWSKVTDEDMEGIVKTAEKYLSTL